ncbi:MAG: alpha/beta hydrolase [Gemmatimonadaceae bacterium]|nr:alpha/beta hydrolase [Gemmatimonadaceae bacterium]
MPHNLRHATVTHRGCPLHYVVRGDTHTNTVLLLQCVGAQGEAWRPQAEFLAQTYRTITVDNRGMAQSVPASAPITVAQMAEDARVILDAEGITRAHVVGHSLGGPVAMQLALDAPDRVASLALLCTFANGRAAAPLTWRMLSLGARTRIGSRASRRRAFLGLIAPPGRIDEFAARADRLAELFGHDLADQPAIANAQLAAMRACDLTVRLRELSGRPVLVASAAWDPIAPPALGRALAAAIPGATYREVVDASHGWPLTHVDEVNALLSAHVERGARG